MSEIPRLQILQGEWSKMLSLMVLQFTLLSKVDHVSIVLYIRIFPNMGDKTHPFTIHDAKN